MALTGALPQSCASVAGFSLPVPQSVFAVFAMLLPSPACQGVKSPVVRYSWSVLSGSGNQKSQRTVSFG